MSMDKFLLPCSKRGRWWIENTPFNESPTPLTTNSYSWVTARMSVICKECGTLLVQGTHFQPCHGQFFHLIFYPIQPGGYLLNLMEKGHWIELEIILTCHSPNYCLDSICKGSKVLEYWGFESRLDDYWQGRIGYG